MNWIRRGLGPSVAIFAAQVAIVAPAFAQQGRGVLTGKVFDAQTKQPVPDVVVTVTSPNLQGEETVVTDASGFYRVPSLPPGDYAIRLEEQAYKPYERRGIALRSDTTLRLDIDLLPVALKADEVVVVGRAPTVDVGSTTAGLNIDSNTTKRVPIARPSGAGGAVRSFEAVAEMAPGAKSDTYGTSIAGTTSPENGYVVDGQTLNSPANGTSAAPLSVEFIKEVNVITGGYMPEYGRSTGGILNTVTKSGSNEFHGSIWGNLTPGALEAPRKLIQRDGTTIDTQRKLNNIGDVGFDIGGPIVKDKLWFYAGGLIAQTTFKLNRNLQRQVVGPDGRSVKDTDGYSIAERIPGTEQRYMSKTTQQQLFGKLTYTLNNRNRFELRVFYTGAGTGGDGYYGGQTQLSGPYKTLVSRDTESTFNSALKWTTENENKKVLLDTTLSWTHQTTASLPVDGSQIGDTNGLAGIPGVTWRRSNPGPHPLTDFEVFPNSNYCDAAGTRNALLCPVQSYNSGGPGFIRQIWANRYQGRSILTLLAEGAGKHVVKTGVDVELMQYDHLRGYSGSVALQESRGGGLFLDSRQYGYLTSPDQAVILSRLRWKTNALTAGGFIQDSWSILDNLTLNAGARYDAQFIFGGEGNLAFSLPNQVSPRVGLIWDPTKQGHSKIYGNYARFYENVPLGIADRAGSGEPSVRSYRPSTACNFRDANQLGKECLDAPRANNPIAGVYSPDRKWAITGSGTVPVDPNLVPQSQSELLFGAEYDIFRNARLGVNYQHRWMDSIIEDMSRDEAQTYFIGNPGRGIAKDFPEAQRIYDAVNVYIQKTFSDRWLAQANYTVSWLRGNYAGLFRPETGQLDPNINSDFDWTSLHANRKGGLPGDRRHEI
jgi:hypothetical protein